MKDEAMERIGQAPVTQPSPMICQDLSHRFVDTAVDVMEQGGADTQAFRAVQEYFDGMFYI